jgi:membrane protease YdiL (CAAX protease family)
LLAYLAGVFKPASVRGPERLGETERVSTIWFILAIGLFTWLFVPAVYAAATLGPPPPTPATNPSTAPSSQPALSQREAVAVNAGAEICVLLSLVVSNGLLRPQGLERLGVKSVRPMRTLKQIAVGVAIVLPLVFVSVLLTQYLWDLIRFEHPNAHELLRIIGQDANPVMRLAVIVSAIVIAPVSEEFLFRGHLQTALRYTLSGWISATTAQWIAIFFASLLFMSVHERWSWPPIFLLSICLGYAYERTANLWIPIFIHASFNAVNVASFLMNPQV